jgi:hypothetical protein
VERLLRTSNGMEVRTTMTDAEAVAVIRATTASRLSGFILGIVMDYGQHGQGLSPNKMAWIHRYAIEIIDREFKDDYSSKIILSSGRGRGAPGHRRRPRHS